MGNSNARPAFTEFVNAISSKNDIDESFLGKLFSLNVTYEDVHEIITADSIRDLRAKQPEKLDSLLRFSVDTMLSMYEKSAGSLILSGGEKVALSNAVRVISRIAPLINDDNEKDAFLAKFWGSETIPESIDSADQESTGFRMIGALMRCCFIRGFSIPMGCSTEVDSENLDPNRVNAGILWGKTGGIGGIPANRLLVPGCSQEMIETRREIVEMILAVLSRPLFQSLEEYREQRPILNSLIVSGDFAHTADFFLSLLVTILDSTSGQERLASSCLDLVNVLLDTPSNEQYPNVYTEILALGLSEPEELVVIARALRERVVSMQAVSGWSLIPRRIRNVNSFILFLFNILRLSGVGLLKEISGKWGSELVIALVTLLQEKSHLPEEVGLVNTISFILIILSANRDFAVDVFNAPFRDANTRLGDLLIQTLLKLLLPTNISSMGEMWLTIICNISPFIAGLDVTTASALVHLTERLVCKKPPNHNKLSLYLFETINNCIQYQYSWNFNLVYCLLLKGQKIIENCSEEKKTETLRRLLGYLSPRIEEACRTQETTDHMQVLSLIKTTSVVGILPIPNAIIIRNFQVNVETKLWFTSFLWGVVFVSSMPPLDWRKVKIINLVGNKTDDEK